MSFSDAIEAINEPLNKLLVPVASSAGRTLQDAWELVFGGFGTYVEKKREVRRKALEDFKSSLEDKVAAIPQDQLCEPSLSIVGPALDASKYYFEEPELREMFANLIASSMDSQKASDVHPSFSEIIRQMSPLDAQNLTYFIAKLPIVEYRLVTEGTNGYQTFLSNVFLTNTDEKDYNKQSVSLASLSRLGLIDISYEQFLTDKSVYDCFEQTDLFREVAASLPENMKLIIKKGVAAPTPLGAQFIRVCLKK